MEKNYIKHENTDFLDLLPVEDIVLFPQVILPFHINDKNQISMIDEILSRQDRMFVVSTVKKESEGRSVYDIGVVCNIMKMLKLPDGSSQILVQGLKRITIESKIDEDKKRYKVKIAYLEEKIPEDDDIEVSALVSNLRKAVERLNNLGKNIPAEFLNYLFNIENRSHFADLIATVLDLSIEDRQKYLEQTDVKKRLEMANIDINREINILAVGQQIQNKVSEKLKKNEKDYLLREQLKAIHQELGETDDKTREIDEFRKKLEKLELSDNVRKEAEKELNRLSRMHSDSAEGSVIRTYLEWICELPWKHNTKDNRDIRKAEKILDKSHYGLKKVKERILEFLAVQRLRKNLNGPILCLAGPPGVGKTSLGKAVADALERKYVRMSLGGLHDESEIRGHRRTYIGAMPGRIIQGLKNAGTANPVFVLDEIDKVSNDFRGDPSAALLEVLDPEQNNTFVDNYLNLPFDLSNVMFIATANSLATIPQALKDRIEVIQISGYTYREKLNIVKKFLLPKQKKANGIEDIEIRISDRTIVKIIQEYTREAGVRNIERIFARICRKIALEYSKDETKKRFSIKSTNIHKYLGAPVFIESIEFSRNIPGITPGLAWTEVGGEVLFIEAIKRAGTGQFILTGQLGNVMKESAQIAFSFIKKVLYERKTDVDFSKTDVHVHIPAGAIPKDGPSAGITIATALYSLFSEKAVREKYAMTGELSLTGRVLPIGGLKEKSLAAFREGYRNIIIPEKNIKDIDDIPEEAAKEMRFIPVNNFEDIIKEVF